MNIPKSIWALVVIFWALHLPGLKAELPTREYTELLFSSPEEMEALIPHLIDIRQTDLQYAKSFQIPKTNYWDPAASLSAYLSEIEREYPLRLPSRTVRVTVNKMKWLGGMPLGSKFPDEQNVIHAISKLSLSPLQINPHYFHYQHFYLYAVAVTLKGADLLGVVHLTPDRGYYMRHPEEARKIFQTAKFPQVILGGFAILLVFLVGQSLFDRRTALLAAFFFAFLPQIAVEVHVLKALVFGQFWAGLALLGLAFFLQRPSVKRIVLAGAAAGLAVGSSVLFAYLVLLIPVAVWMRKNPGKRIADAGVLGLIGCAAAGLSFFVTNPHVVLSLDEFLLEVKNSAQGKTFLDLFPHWEYHRHIWKHVLVSNGFLFGLLSLAGFFLCLFRKTKTDRFLAIGWVVYYFLAFQALCLPPSQTGRRLIPFAIIGSLLAARALASVWNRKKLPGLTSPPVFAGLVALSLVAPTLFYAHLHIFDNTRVEAGRWVNAHIPSGSSIGNAIAPDGGKVSSYLPFRYLEYLFVNDPDPRLSKIRKELPDYYIALNVFGLEEDPFLSKEELLAEYERVKTFRHTVPLLCRFYVNRMVFGHLDEIQIFRRAGRKRAGSSG